MREIFEDAFENEPLDATEAARRAARPQLRRKFYQSVEIAETNDGFVLLLDGRSVRTPAGNLLKLPVRGLGEAVAAEWTAQIEVIDPYSMPLTRLANTIIDGVARQPAPVAEEVKKYLGSDLLYYRADRPAGLVERQSAAWDPILEWAHAQFGARFVLSEGIVFADQPDQSLRRTAEAIPEDPWRLGAVHVMTTLTGSALIALAVLRGRLNLEEAWKAAHIDEDWNMEQWGQDDLALERRTFRFADMKAAATVVQCCAGS